MCLSACQSSETKGMQNKKIVCTIFLFQYTKYRTAGGVRGFLCSGYLEWMPGHFSVIFKLILGIDGRAIALKWVSLDLTDDKSNIGSGNGLVLWGDNTLPEPVLTQF